MPHESPDQATQARVSGVHIRRSVVGSHHSTPYPGRPLLNVASLAAKVPFGALRHVIFVVSFSTEGTFANEKRRRLETWCRSKPERGFRDTLLRRSVLECAAVPMRSLMITTYCLVRCGTRLMVAQVLFLRCNGCLHGEATLRRVCSESCLLRLSHAAGSPTFPPTLSDNPPPYCFLHLVQPADVHQRHGIPFC
ncbi:hypothetical protein BDP81DRAFT_412250 [Colletotrichum phormii]|uniref:Uncharacterized protein n=1 Tax=Colletotrichum phormii TaxID=359342 RepID=A0AAJ0EN85_9PEZI|nr:uncharacterized protein BDP81DRAFT_412250 [Colletotrichum phormii]KAK1655218.1 hypothetical protein BDP81DRAFT_412250 [Colletotrichum phormii]